MRELNIEYVTWRSVLDANPRWVVHYLQDGSSQYAWAGTLDYLYKTVIYEEDMADHIAWAISRTTVSVVSEDDAVAVIIGVGPIANIRTEDGRPMIQPVTLDRGLWHWYHSVGDDLIDGRGAGPSFQLQATLGNPNPTVTWQYNDWCEMAGGVASYRNAELGDYVVFKLFFPASVPTSTPGTGNCSKIPIGPGINILVPAAGNGDWTLNLSDRTSAVPVPAEDVSGYWEWSWPDIGVGTVNPGAPGKSHYNLFDFPIDPGTRFVPRVNLLGTGVISFQPENVHPSDVLPHWKMQCGLNHAGGVNTLDLVWHVVCARKDTR